MSKLFDYIQAERLKARKAGPSQSVVADLLATVTGEVNAVAKNDGNREVTDQDVLKVLKKFAEGSKEMIRLAPESGLGRIATVELNELTKYLPQQMSEDELRNAISDLIATGVSTLPMMMAALKTNYNGRYDGKLASTLVKELLK